MLQIPESLRAFSWFLWQSIIFGFGSLGMISFLVLLACLLVLLILGFRRSPSSIRRRFWLLAALPAMWMFVGIWGVHFWHEAKRQSVENPAWVSWPAIYGFWVFLLVAAFLIFYLKNGRLFATAFAAINLYMMFSMCLIATMAIRDDWL